ncbi:MAG: NrfD/PsrC family molybdoenzyme membrane anchor subunit [Candidatus Hydrothermarchaeota archaeon]
MWAIALVGLVFGSFGIWDRLVTGHVKANYGSYVVWGLWVAAYIYFVGLSAGAFLISSLIYAFGVRRLERVGKLALFVALVTLFMALLIILLDLGHMSRFYWVYTRANFSSMMTWMVWLYTAYFLLLLAESWLALKPDLIKGLTPETLQRDRRLLKYLGTIGVPLAIAFHGGVGALFGTVVARPYWHTPLYPILFLTGALVSGGALMTATVAFFWPDRNEGYRDTVKYLGQIVLMILVFDLILEFAEFSIPMWYGVGPEYELMRKVLFGSFWWVFWVVHLLLGSLIPIGILATQRERPLRVGAAGLLISFTFMAARLNIVVPGLIEPQLRGLEEAFHDPRLVFQYFPSLFEWQVFAFVIALGIALFCVGQRLLPLMGERPTERSV